MTTTELATHIDARRDALAWSFLESEFAAPDYVNWPLERRLDAYLSRRGRVAERTDGTEFEALIQRVMHTIGPALRRGVLQEPWAREPQ